MNLHLLDSHERLGFAANRPSVTHQDRFLDLAMRCLMLNAAVPDRLLRRLGQRGMLNGVIAKLEANATRQPAEAYLWTRAQQFLARYENAAAGYGLLAAHWPNNQGLVTAQATLARSLADSFHVHDPALYTRAAELHGRLAERYPLATADRVLQGETLLEAGRPREAATAWERLPAAAPGDSSRWLDLATLYWDYFQPLHAMEVLAEARRVTKRPHLFAKEMGYLLEDRGRLVDAVNEFIEAVLLADEGGFEVSQRLFYLVNSKKIALAAVDAAFRRRLTGPAGTSQEAATYVQWLRDHGLVEQAKQTARALLPQYADTVLAERAYELFVEYGDDAGTKASLDRLIEISRRDPAMIRRLVAYHENRKELDAADALVEGMAARDGSPDAKRDALAYAAEYFWRTERRDRALDYYRRQAEQSRRQPLHDWVIYADRCLQAERQDLALDAMTKLRRAHPLDPALLRVMAGAYAARSDRAGLVTLYRDALKDLRQAALEPQAKKDREIDLRRLLAAALTDMGLPRDALEEHIQIVNRLAPDVESVVLAFRFAQQHNLVPVLAAHYEREVERASRDFRWQFVTALLYEAQGRYADAARLLAKASANEPQRLDLLERRATALIKAGDFDGAVAVYRTLAGRRLKGEDYQLRVAEVLYLAGKPQDAESWLDQILAAPDVEPTRVAAAARLAQRFGRELAERKYTQQAVQLVLAEPDRREIEADILQIWLRGQLETSGVERTLAALADMRQKLQQAKVTMHPVGRQRIEKTLQALDGLVSRGFVDWLRAHADGPARQAAAEPFAALLMEPIQNAPLNKRKAAYLEAITAAQGAQLPEVAERFYRQFTKEWHALIGGANDKPAAAETLVSTGKTRARTEPLAALNAEWQSLPAAPAPAHAPWTHLQAVLARAAGDEAAERLALERWFNAQRPNKKFVAPDPLTARYFSLLDDARLDEFAHGDCRLAGPLVLWLARQGQTTRLIAALDHHYRDKGPQWLLAKKALAYQGDPKYRPATGQAYVELLGLPLTVGTLVGAKAPPARVTERNWTHYADRYAQWLAQQQDAAGFHLLFARPERSPTSAEAYLHVVDNLDRAERFTAADYFLAQAEQLGEERKLIVARARHWQAQGKTGQAATELARLVQPAPVSLDQWSNYAHLMGEIDRAAAGLERWQQGVVEALPRLSNYSRRDVLQQLLEFAEARLGEKRAAAVARDVLSAFPFTAEDLRAMLDNDALPEPVVSWAWSQALDRLDRDPRATVYAKYSLADGALTQALTVKDKGLIRRALASLEKTNPREFDGDPMRLRRLQASIVLDGAKASEALATRFVTGRTDHGLIDDVWQTLRDAGWPDAADRVWLAFYEPIRNDPKMATRYVSDDSTDGETRDLADADLTTLGAYLRLGQAAKARTLLTELEGAAGTNASSLTAIADVLLTNRALNEAVRLADRAAALFPMNRTTHQTRLLIYLAAGRTDEAARQLSTGWQAGIYSRQELQSVLHQLATEAAHGKYTGRWDESAKALPTPLRELVRAELAVVRGRGEDAVQILAGLAEPYRYPSLVWRLRAEAHRLAGKAALEYAAWSAYLRYFPADIQAQDRLAWLELGHRPIAGLTRLACQRMPLAPWEQADPLIVTGAPLQRLRQWWNGVAKQDRAEMALAVIDAFVAIDRPAAGLAVGQAAVTSLRDGAPAKLRDRVKQLAKEIDQRRAAQPSRFLPNENLVQ
jgi:predicted Zn-dependent protease